MGKTYAVRPSHYFELEDGYLATAVDIACAAVMWEDENTKFDSSKDTAKQESGMLAQKLDQYMRQVNER